MKITGPFKIDLIGILSTKSLADILKLLVLGGTLLVHPRVSSTI